MTLLLQRSPPRIGSWDGAQVRNPEAYKRLLLVSRNKDCATAPQDLSIMDKQHESMSNNSSAFLKGGVGCFLVFIVLALLALLAGGSVRLDLGGVLLLFIIGGLIGLAVNWIYQKGRKDASDQDDDSHA